MSLRKYLMSGHLAASTLAVLPVVTASRRPVLGQRSWVLWLGWGLGVVAAVLTVRQESELRRTTRRVSAERR